MEIKRYSINPAQAVKLHIPFIVEDKEGEFVRYEDVLEWSRKEKDKCLNQQEK